MPRLNSSTYLHHHYQLKEMWLVHQNVFSYLRPADQLDLHKYFQFASDKTEAELLEHRRNVHALDPSLPQRAGRAYAKLAHGERAPVRSTGAKDGREISVRFILRPEPDLKLYVRAVRYKVEREMKTRMRREKVLTRAAIRAIYPPREDAA